MPDSEQREFRIQSFYDGSVTISETETIAMETPRGSFRLWQSLVAPILRIRFRKRWVAAFTPLLRTNHEPIRPDCQGLAFLRM